MAPSLTRSRSFITSPTVKSLLSGNIPSHAGSASNDGKLSRSPSISTSTFSDRTELDLAELSAKFKKNVTIKDRRYRLKVYRNCFIGSEAVQWMVTSGTAETREDAVKLGILMQEAGLIEHCVRDHEFKDEMLFYKFIEDSERGGVPKSGGRLVSWADFVSPSMQAGRSLQPRMPDPRRETENTTSVEPERATFWPMDEANVKLLDNVHPPEWIEPKHEGVYNLIVIGAGTGGLVTSSGAAGVGAKVALIEGNVLGGDSLNVGCVPSKSLIHAANLAHTLKNSSQLEEAGLSLHGPVEVDFAQTMRRLRDIRAEISSNNSAARYTRRLGVDIYFGYARFTSENTVEVNGKILTFRKAVIATGGFPSIPSIPGLRELHDKSVAAMDNFPHPAVMTNETFFNITALPNRLAVIGSGAVGAELGQAMQRLGSAVTIFGHSGKILPKEDEDLSEIVKYQMETDGVVFHLSVSKFLSVELSGLISKDGYEEVRITTEEEEVEREYLFDAVLICTGRKPNVSGLDLEAAAVKYDMNRGLHVNDMLQTTNPRIYGVGDCCSAYKFAHAADFMARMVIRNTLFLGKDKVSNLLIPYATFTSPEIAHVGLYEADLKENGIRYRTFEKHFKDNDRAICDSAREGMVRIHVEERSDVILGASIIGSNAGNMISELTLAMQSKTGLGTLASVIHPYPTTGEAIRETGDLYNKARLTTTVKQLLRGVMSLQR